MIENAELNTIFSRLSGKAPQYFPAEADSDSSFQLSGLSQRNYSTIYFFDLTGNRSIPPFRPAIAVKIFHERTSGVETAALQYRSLASLWPRFRGGGNSNIGLPQPLDYFSDLPALVMERVRGSSLQALFSKMNILPSQRRQLTSACARTGQWLRELHRVTSVGQGRLVVEEKLAHASANLARLETMGFSPELCRRSADFLKRQADQLSIAESHLALVHGDFTVDNVMVDGDRIVALDLTGRDHNAIEHDLATFLNSLRLLRLTMPVSRALLSRCSHSFLAGYFGVNHSPSPALNFLRVAGLISTALEIAGRRWDRLWTRLWVRRFFNQELGGLVRS